MESGEILDRHNIFLRAVGVVWALYLGTTLEWHVFRWKYPC